MNLVEKDELPYVVKGNHNMKHKTIIAPKCLCLEGPGNFVLEVWNENLKDLAGNVTQLASSVGSSWNWWGLSGSLLRAAQALSGSSECSS